MGVRYLNIYCGALTGDLGNPSTCYEKLCGKEVEGGAIQFIQF